MSILIRKGMRPPLSGVKWRYKVTPPAAEIVVLLVEHISDSGQDAPECYSHAERIQRNARGETTDPTSLVA